MTTVDQNGVASAMAAMVGPYDIAMVTLDTLRHDVAAGQLAAGGTPQLARVLPGGRWQPRHSPASFTFAAHQAFFAGFLPTPDSVAHLIGTEVCPGRGACDDVRAV